MGVGCVTPWLAWQRDPFEAGGMHSLPGYQEGIMEIIISSPKQHSVHFYRCPKLPDSSQLFPHAAPPSVSCCSVPSSLDDKNRELAHVAAFVPWRPYRVGPHSSLGPTGRSEDEVLLWLLPGTILSTAQWLGAEIWTLPSFSTCVCPSLSCC